VAFEPALAHIPDGKGVYTGLPIRQELLKGNRQKGLALCGLKGDKPVLLIMGGSLGAKAVNDILDSILDKLTIKYDVVHIRGKDHLKKGLLPGGYKQFGFVGKELADIYAAADIMVSRAGATAVFEILALAIPALLIPLPKAVSRGDQILNAQCFREQSYVHVLDQDGMTGDVLLDAIDRLYQDKDILRKRMKQANVADAAGNVAKIIADV
jgi:UDP-N-acetylglucosamine--N-acetylmuramyl-(pentapeptide) pyrophosphoryl-undecaprenol N-acetylglucosamine transferase